MERASLLRWTRQLFQAVKAAPRGGFRVFAILWAGTALAEDALIYDGPGICDGCAVAAVDLVHAAGYEARIVGPGALTPVNLRGAPLFVVGGGDDIETIAHAMGEPGLEAIRAYVASGGHYLGICAGAYLSEEALDKAGEVPGLGIFDGETYPETPFEAAVAAVKWEGIIQPLYVQEAPGFRLSGAFTGEVIARYQSGVPAALLADYGQGRVALTGPHPEAGPDWLAGDGLPPQPLAPPALGIGLIERLMRAR